MTRLWHTPASQSQWLGLGLLPVDDREQKPLYSVIVLDLFPQPRSIQGNYLLSVLLLFHGEGIAPPGLPVATEIELVSLYIDYPIHTNS